MTYALSAYFSYAKCPYSHNFTYPSMKCPYAQVRELNSPCAQVNTMQGVTIKPEDEAGQDDISS